MSRHPFQKKLILALTVFAMIGMVTMVFSAGLRSITPENRPQEKPQSKMNDLEHLKPQDRISLPEPVTDGSISLEKALSLRRSVRNYADSPMEVKEVSQLLWSGQGITAQGRLRTAPSAGATHPLTLFLMVNNVEGLPQGLYRYQPEDHVLVVERLENISTALAEACLGQRMITSGAIVIIFAADFERTTRRYGTRGERYVYNEVGHASQNIHLQAATLNLGTVVVGAFRDEEVESVLAIDDVFRVLYLMPVGRLRP